MTTKSKAEAATKGKGRGAASALHALYRAGEFDFINNMLGRTVAAVSAGLGIEPPAKFGDPQERPTVEDFARWLEKVPPTFDPHETEGGRPPELYNERGVQRNPLTGAELAELAQEVGSYFTANAKAASLYLLLLYALSNEHDEADRSAAYFEACEGLAGTIEGVTKAFEADHIRTLARLRKGGA